MVFNIPEAERFIVSPGQVLGWYQVGESKLKSK